MEQPATISNDHLLKHDSAAESYSDTAIPTWGDLQNVYERRWLQEKNKFQTQLKTNFLLLWRDLLLVNKKYSFFLLLSAEKNFILALF